MMRLKSENLALVAHVKDMEALLQSKQISVPLLKNKANQSPESTPQTQTPSASADQSFDMLAQINDLEAKESINKLENSMKPGGLGN